MYKRVGWNGIAFSMPYLVMLKSNFLYRKRGRNDEKNENYGW